MDKINESIIEPIPMERNGDNASILEFSFLLIQKSKKKLHHLEPRKYQLEVAENSYLRNSIIFLETGTGKTIISIHIMNKYLEKFENEAKIEQQNIRKKICFLTNTKQLAEQQKEQIRNKLLIFRNSDRPYEKILCIHGESESFQNKNALEECLENIEIFVMTAQTFLNQLRRGYFPLCYVGLIIFDECHHCDSEHPYNLIMQEFYFWNIINKTKKELPFILGLTASPIKSNSKTVKIQDSLIDLCVKLDSVFAKYDIDNVKEYLTSAKVKVLEYPEDEFLNEYGNNFLDKLLLAGEASIIKEAVKKFKCFDKFFEDISSKYEDIKANISKNFAENFLQKLFNNLPKHALELKHEIGFFAVSCLFKDLLENIMKNINKIIDLHNVVDLEYMKELTQAIQDFIEGSENHLKKNLIKHVSLKSKVLLETIENEFKDENKENIILIFVEKKQTAKYLNLLIQEYFKNEKYKADYVIGMGTKKDANSQAEEVKAYDGLSPVEEFFREFRESLDYSKHLRQRAFDPKIFELAFTNNDQQEVLCKFKNKKIHILISTSVTEEGFDVPSCNLVISFNKVKSIRSFIQLKGRGRKKDSIFYIMAQKKLARETNNVIEDYNVCLNEIKQKVFVLEGEDFENKKRMYLAKEIFLVKPFETNRNAFVNNNWSNEILKNYVSFLKRIPFTLNKTIDLYLELEFEGKSNKFMCMVIFPNTCRLSFYYHNDSFSNKGDAQKVTYFKAVEKLYLEGGHFCPDMRPIHYDCKPFLMNDPLLIDHDAELNKNTFIRRAISLNGQTKLAEFYLSENEEVLRNYSGKQNYYLYLMKFEKFENWPKIGFLCFHPQLGESTARMENHFDENYKLLRLPEVSLSLLSDPETYQLFKKASEFLQISTLLRVRNFKDNLKFKSMKGKSALIVPLAEDCKEFNIGLIKEICKFYDKLQNEDCLKDEHNEVKPDLDKNYLFYSMEDKIIYEFLGIDKEMNNEMNKDNMEVLLKEYRSNNINMEDPLKIKVTKFEEDFLKFPVNRNFLECIKIFVDSINNIMEIMLAENFKSFISSKSDELLLQKMNYPRFDSVELQNFWNIDFRNMFKKSVEKYELPKERDNHSTPNKNYIQYVPIQNLVTMLQTKKYRLFDSYDDLWDQLETNFFIGEQIVRTLLSCEAFCLEEELQEGVFYKFYDELRLEIVVKDRLRSLIKKLINAELFKFIMARPRKSRPWVVIPTNVDINKDDFDGDFFEGMKQRISPNEFYEVLYFIMKEMFTSNNNNLQAPWQILHRLEFFAFPQINCYFNLKEEDSLSSELQQIVDSHTKSYYIFKNKLLFLNAICTAHFLKRRNIECIKKTEGVFAKLKNLYSINNSSKGKGEEIFSFRDKNEKDVFDTEMKDLEIKMNNLDLKEICQGRLAFLGDTLFDLYSIDVMLRWEEKKDFKEKCFFFADDDTLIHGNIMEIFKINECENILTGAQKSYINPGEKQKLFLITLKAIFGAIFCDLSFDFRSTANVLDSIFGSSYVDYCCNQTNYTKTNFFKYSKILIQKKLKYIGYRKNNIIEKPGRFQFIFSFIKEGLGDEIVEREIIDFDLKSALKLLYKEEFEEFEDVK